MEERYSCCDSQESATLVAYAERNLLNGLCRNEYHPIFEQSRLPLFRQSAPNVLRLPFHDRHSSEKYTYKDRSCYELVGTDLEQFHWDVNQWRLRLRIAPMDVLALMSLGPCSSSVSARGL